MIFALLTLLAALALAAVAGWFSIIGVMAIYAGAPLHALVMGITLEAGKLVTTSWLYRNWSFSDWKLKTPLIIFTFALMLATSIGVFGFLSKSHLEQGAKTINNGPRVERIEQQIAKEKAIITDNEKVIAQLDATINSYLGKDRTDRSVLIRRSQAPQRKQLKDEIDAANKRIDGFSDEKFKLQSEIRSLELEVGPIRYIAELIYGTEGNSTKNIESAVKIFTLLIVSTLDPLAVILLVAANHSILRRQNEKKQKADEKQVGNNYKEIPPESEGPAGIEKPNPIDGRAGDESEISGTVSTNEETTLHAEIPVNEEEKVSAKKDFWNLEIPIYIENEESGTINNILSKKESTATSETATIKEIQQKIDEKEDSTLERLQGAAKITSLPVIRSPNPTSVEVPARDVEISNIATEETSRSSPPVSGLREPWANQGAVLREILGIKAHFVPQKINEEENIAPAEKRGGDTGIAQPTPKVEEIFVEGPENKHENSGMEGIYSGNVRGTHKNTYPKTLGWLTEFRGTENDRN